MTTYDDIFPRLTAEEINTLPLFSYSGRVELVNCENDLAPALALLAEDHVLGFDTETKPSFTRGQLNPPSLLQLAGRHATVLIRLNRVSLPRPAMRILADPDVVKVGVAVADDVRALMSLSSFTPAGFVDLGETARLAGLPASGLRSLAASLLEVRVSKSVRCSNWERGELTNKQVAYAATDAWVSRELFGRFTTLGLLGRNCFD